ncbi:uncharacterized protein [Macrobrachium rosenbergii]|uniref:uncharacterized protein n=1 Tax=Macrobrachium rosenbergii TaxID=79674 RepID=UPI0034D74B5E
MSGRGVGDNMNFKQAEREFLIECIRLYKELPSLWKIKADDYNDHNKKWEDCIILLKKYRERYPKAGVEDVKKKFNSLRTNFRKELKKVQSSKKSGAGSEDIYEPTLWYYNEMEFLQDQETPSESISMINDAEDSDLAGELNLLFVGRILVKQSVPMQRKVDEQRELASLACKRLRGIENKYERLASAWALELQEMDSTQAAYAKKAFNDIMFEGQMGILHRDSVIINRQHNTAGTPSGTPKSSATNK